MTFDEVLDQIREMLQSKGRLSYRALKRRFDLDDEYLEDLKAELIKAEGVAIDENGEVLVWVGNGINRDKDQRITREREEKKTKEGKDEEEKDSGLRTLNSELSAAERRQLTVMFCDLVGSTALSAQLDPEEFREVVQGYQQTSAAIIERYSGHIAQYLGDGLLVYFGYPVAHEDDAARAVRAGLEIIQALRDQVTGNGGQGKREPLHVRIGIHTGLVVIGEIGGGNRQELLALGETPNVAARIQGLTNPDEVVISAVTQKLVSGLFECQELGPQTLKGVTVPMTLYRVVRGAEAQSRFEAAMRTGLTPLMGREEELTLLRRRWEQAKEGEGQVVLLSGEAGIGKSRLVQELKDQVVHNNAVRIEFRCSPYHQNSALYPLIDHLQRLLGFEREDSPEEKLKKLEEARGGAHSRAPLPSEAIPLLATLFSLPHPDGYPPLTFSPQKQKEKTHEVLVAWLIAETKQHPVYTIWEDLHWVDPSTLEVLNLIVDQAPTTKLYLLLTSRPEFIPSWGNRSHFSQVTLSRLGRDHIEAMVERVAGSTALSHEVVQQIVSKTDGVPLFVEELTKSAVESVGATGRSPLQLEIPATLQDALMARLDRLGAAKEIAQLGATIGREFSYELLHAVSLVNNETLQHGLKQLVEAELVYQRGLLPQAHYLFKHALIQDTAYQSLLKSTRQQYHQQIAKVLEDRFPDTKENQPELLAHHYAEGGLIAQAIPYWQQASQRATQRSAYVEAIRHLTTALELLNTLPETPARMQQELALQLALGIPLQTLKGEAAPEVGQTYNRVLELCEQVGETAPLFPALFGLWRFYLLRADLHKARELAEQMLRLAQSSHDPSLLLEAYRALGESLFLLGDLRPGQRHLEQGIALYDIHHHRSHVFLYGSDPGVHCLGNAAWNLWCLGYPEQALKNTQDALHLAHEVAHLHTLVLALNAAAYCYQFRHEATAVREQAEALLTLSAEHRFAALRATVGAIMRDWALAATGQLEEPAVRIQEKLAALGVTGSGLAHPYFQALQAEIYGKMGRPEEGLAALAEAAAIVQRTGEQWYEAELYRLRGTLTLQSQASLGQVSGKSQASQDKFENTDPQPLPPDPQGEAEACFLKAIEIARKQQAKSLELRAATSLARLWQRQEKKVEAHKLLSDIYDWFTEGFDTKDLQEAKALLEEL